MDTAFIVIGGIVLAAAVYAVYDSTRPASGVRARNNKGHCIKDDPSTAKNEAYVDGKTPPAKKKAPVKRKPAAKKKPAAKQTVAKKAPAKRRTNRKTVAKK